MQVIIFKLNDEQFAVETAKVQNITDMMQITRVPKAPEYIRGLINLRGNVISLLDINLVLDVNKGDIDKQSIIIIRLRDEAVGIAVDQVDEVLEVDEEIIEKLEDNRGKTYVKGVINFKDRIVTLIDIDKLISN